jgi:hypothetical protein
MLSHFSLVNSSFTSILLNNFASSSCLCLCSLLYAPLSLLFVIISQSHFLHSCFCDLQNFKNAHNFRQETKTIFEGYTIFFRSWTSRPLHSFFTYLSSFN